MPTTEPEDGDNESTSGKPAGVALELTPTLEAELDAFTRFRTQPLNMHRSGASVVQITQSINRCRVVQFLGWLQKQGTEVSLGRVFSSTRCGTLVQQFVNDCVATRGHKWSSVTNHVAALLACARFVHAAHEAQTKETTATAAVVNQLSTLHLQCRKKSREQAKFDLSKKPAAWLDWAACQRARARCEQTYSTFKGSDAKKRRLLQDLIILLFTTTQPPDRVGVVRLLRLGDTLKRTDNGYDLDLSEPGCHKTSLIFGPTITSVAPSISAKISEYIALHNKPDTYIFCVKGNPSRALTPSGWTKRVQICFKRHAGVPFSPKDLRGEIKLHTHPCIGLPNHEFPLTLHTVSQRASSPSSRASTTARQYSRVRLEPCATRARRRQVHRTTRRNTTGSLPAQSVCARRMLPASPPHRPRRPRETCTGMDTTKVPCATHDTH